MYYNNNYGMNNMNQNKGILQTLHELVTLGDNGYLTAEVIKSKVENLHATGQLKIAGVGTNRIAVEVNPAVLQGLTDITPSKPMIIKIPYSRRKGINDNFREYLLYKFLQMKASQISDPDLKYLLDTLPEVSAVRGYPSLIAQEKVRPIQEVVSNISRDQNNPNALDNIAKDSMDLILGHQYRNQYVRLLSALDKYCVFADLNPLVTPFQYGFKQVNGSYSITILDTGYTIPRFYQVESSNNIQKRRYLIVGKDIDLVQNTEFNTGKQLYKLVSNIESLSQTMLNTIQPQITQTMGMYILSNISGQTPSVSELVVLDMPYWKEYYTQARLIARQNFGSEVAQYFSLLTGLKSF